VRIKRVLYFSYYLRKVDWTLLKKFQKHYRKEYGMSSFKQWYLVFVHSLCNRISILEYYQFDFHSKSRAEKKKLAGTGFMHEYKRVINPISA